MKILHVIARFHLGGSEQVAARLCIGLVAQGHECAVIAITTPEVSDPVGDALKHDLIARGVAVLELPATSFRQAGFLGPRRLVRVINSWKPDIVHSHTDRPDFVVSLARRLVPFRVARTIHNSQLWSTHFVLGYIAESGLSNDLIVPLSEPSQRAYNDLRERYRLRPSKHQYMISNGVELYPASVRHSRLELRQFGANLDRIQLCFAGRFTHQKGFDVLLSALARLDATTQQRIEIHAFGAGEDKANLSRAVENAGAPVQFHAPLPEIARWFTAFDAVLIPSRFEGQPLTALECMVAGVPIIAAAAPGLREVLPSEWPLVAEVGNPRELAAKLTAFVERSESYRQLSRAMAGMACQRYSSKRMVEEYALAYQRYCAL